MQTGENQQALRKVLDMTRVISIMILVLHVYYELYAAFEAWQLTLGFTDRLLDRVQATGLFTGFHRPKLIALGFLFISLLGARAAKHKSCVTRQPLPVWPPGCCSTLPVTLPC